jgi:hypothetical protein
MSSLFTARGQTQPKQGSEMQSSAALCQRLSLIVRHKQNPPGFLRDPDLSCTSGANRTRRTIAFHRSCNGPDVSLKSRFKWPLGNNRLLTMYADVFHEPLAREKESVIARWPTHPAGIGPKNSKPAAEERTGSLAGRGISTRVGCGSQLTTERLRKLLFSIALRITRLNSQVRDTELVEPESSFALADADRDDFSSHEDPLGILEPVHQCCVGANGNFTFSGYVKGLFNRRRNIHPPDAVFTHEEQVDTIANATAPFRLRNAKGG